MMLKQKRKAFVEAAAQEIRSLPHGILITSLPRTNAARAICLKHYDAAKKAGLVVSKGRGDYDKTLATFDQSVDDVLWALFKATDKKELFRVQALVDKEAWSVIDEAAYELYALTGGRYEEPVPMDERCPDSIEEQVEIILKQLKRL